MGFVVYIEELYNRLAFHVEHYVDRPHPPCAPAMLRCKSAIAMPEFCNVALPVPLDIAFTYRVPEGMQPVAGGRVLVPFRQQRMSGVVTALHDRAPKAQAKNIVSVLDAAPVLDQQLIRLGKWIADYYLAPLG